MKPSEQMPFKKNIHLLHLRIDFLLRNGNNQILIFPSLDRFSDSLSRFFFWYASQQPAYQPCLKNRL
jgi:hypothetical protein